jgi:hypothetical protein
VKVKVKNVRLAFPVLWEPEFKTEDAKQKTFSAIGLMAPNHPSVKDINDTIDAVIREKWGDKAEQVKSLIKAGGPDRTCLRDGNGKPNYDGFPGNLYISASSVVRPGVKDQARVDCTEADGKVYAGCYVDLIIDIYGYDKPRPGVTAQLMGVQKRADGDAFGGGRPASEEDYDDLSTGEEDSLA